MCVQDASAASLVEELRGAISRPINKLSYSCQPRNWSFGCSVILTAPYPVRMHFLGPFVAFELESP